MHPDTVPSVLPANYFRASENFHLGKFFLLFIFFRVAFWFSILAIGIERVIAQVLNTSNPKPKSRSWRA